MHVPVMTRRWYIITLQYDLQQIALDSRDLLEEARSAAVHPALKGEPYAVAALCTDQEIEPEAIPRLLLHGFRPTQHAHCTANCTVAVGGCNLYQKNCRLLLSDRIVHYSSTEHCIAGQQYLPLYTLRWCAARRTGPKTVCTLMAQPSHIDGHCWSQTTVNSSQMALCSR